jgi:hypothetical protein
MLSRLQALFLAARGSVRGQEGWGVAGSRFCELKFHSPKSLLQLSDFDLYLAVSFVFANKLDPHCC